MLEAKDTVVHADGCSTNLGIIGAICNCGSEAQAEISFNAGYEAHVAEWNEGGLARGIREGIREVVDWVLAHSQLERCDPDVMTYFIDYLAVDYPDWEAQLKKWGKKK